MNKTFDLSFLKFDYQHKLLLQNLKALLFNSNKEQINSNSNLNLNLFLVSENLNYFFINNIIDKKNLNFKLKLLFSEFKDNLTKETNLNFNFQSLNSFKLNRFNLIKEYNKEIENLYSEAYSIIEESVLNEESNLKENIKQFEYVKEKKFIFNLLTY